MCTGWDYMDRKEQRSIDHDLGLCRLPTLPDFAVATGLHDLAGLVRLHTVRAAYAAE